MLIFDSTPPWLAPLQGGDFSVDVDQILILEESEVQVGMLLSSYWSSSCPFISNHVHGRTNDTSLNLLNAKCNPSCLHYVEAV